jgi:DNA helicase-2/ATP-dependent DNA helicase PcrA
MLHQIKITDSDISYAEKILLPKGSFFDDERKIFIKDLSTLDLQAVPGSGKTTALLAKLLILDRYLPFKDGSGILVISHTNIAIDEIKEKIGKYCTNIFNYPNFIGTIHSFINSFLCIPFYENKFHRKISFIDNISYYKYHKPATYGTKYYLDQKNKTVEYDFRLFNGDIYPTGSISKASFKNKTGKTLTNILEIKNELRDKGFLCYDDAFLMGFEYIKEQPEIKIFFKKRFIGVFVDEFQDMDELQYLILEELFLNDNVIYQRIGDNNQSIYSSVNNNQFTYLQRNNTLSLNTSHRLNKKVSSVLEPFSKSHTKITGIKLNTDESEINIKPCLLVYEDSSIQEVIPWYGNKVKELISDNKIPADDRYHAIGWNTKGGVGKIGVDSYFPNFARTSNSTNELNSIRDYVHVKSDQGKYKYIKNSIINALLKILRIEEIKNEYDKFFSSYSLTKYIKERSDVDYDEFKLKVTEISFRIQKENFEEAYKQFKDYIPNFLSYFEKSIINSPEFIKGELSGSNSDSAPDNFYRIENTNIKVGSVHSVKGQTHTTTLYLETSYYKKTETERLDIQFLGRNFNQTKEKHIQSVKMIYVGFSRPTHYLCFAVSKNRYEKHLKDKIPTENWDIVEL